MDDRVGDVLAQRAALDRGVGVGIALSLLLHGALTGAAVWTALRHHETQTAGVMMIKFAAPPRAARAKAAVATPATITQPAVAPKPAPLEKPEVPQPKKPTAAPKPEKNTVPFSPFGKSNKKGSEQAAPSVATAPAAATKPGVTTGAQVPVGGTGVTGLEGGDFPYTLYITRMNSLIASHWYRPVNGTATVHFVIDRDGSIRNATIETPSGNDMFDRAVLRAVLESSPLPPLPFGYDGTYLGVHLTFK